MTLEQRRWPIDAPPPSIDPTVDRTIERES
jgi:hypothetical protein